MSNTSAKERQHKCEVLISEAMGIASVQNPFTDRNMPYEQPFQPNTGDAEAVPIFVILSKKVRRCKQWKHTAKRTSAGAIFTMLTLVCVAERRSKKI